MTESSWPKIWEPRKKHRKVNRRQWREGVALEYSRRRGRADSPYNPIVFGSDEAVRALEMRCVEEGVLIADFPAESPVKRTYYLETDDIVGVCCGVETRYVYAEHHQAGHIHGRPISPSALREMGITL